MQNFGYIEQGLDPKDWILGALSPMPKVVVRQDGQWDDFLPELEIQRFPWGDSMACVSFSFLNVLETLQRAHGEKPNYADRALAKASGTSKSGNSMRTVADTARKFGLVDESLHPASAISWEDYYRELPNSVVLAAEVFRKSHEIQYETVFNYADQMCEALQYSPLQIAIYAYGEVVDGIYQNPGNRPSTHCVMLYGYEYRKYWKIYDHYANAFKKLAWGHNMTFIYRINIQKSMPEMNPLGLANNTLCQLVEAPGGVGLFLDNAILTGPLDKVHFAWDMRNKTADRDARKRTMTAAEWNQYQKKPLP